MTDMTEWVPLGAIVIKSEYGLSLATDDCGNVPILGMTHLQDGKIYPEDCANVSIPDDIKNRYLIRRGDLLFNRTNSAALVGKSAVALDDMDCVFASYIVRFRFDLSRVRPAFIGYVFNMDSSIDQFRKLATPGVSQCNINPTTLRQHFKVCLPSLKYQDHCVSVLSIWDRAIKQMDQLISAKRRHKQILMQQLLTGKRRFKEFVKSSAMRDTKFGPVPMDWQYLKVADFASEVSERNADGAELPVLSCSKYDGLVESLKYFGKRVFSEDTTNYKVVRRNQFAYPCNHVEEGSIGILDFLDAGIVSPIYAVFQTAARVHVPFLYALFKTPLYRHIFEVSTSSSVDRRGSLRWSQFALIKVALPGLEEQKKIAECLAICDHEIGSLCQRLDALKRQKKGLMQQLLTGRVRVHTKESE